MGLGMDMQNAIVKVDQSCGLAEEAATAPAPGVPTIADNNRALAELQSQLKGLS